ncbi:MAG: hypothetical protein PVF49_10720 [Anaerolineales bacterium]
MARTFEAAGLPTVFVTMMPYWAEKIGVPRTLAVEHPFGQTLGMAGDIDGQMNVLRRALHLLEAASQPGQIDHWPEPWPIEAQAAIAAWQPPVPSPIIAHLKPRFRDLLRQRRKQDSE